MTTNNALDDARTLKGPVKLAQGISLDRCRGVTPACQTQAYY